MIVVARGNTTFLSGCRQRRQCTENGCGRGEGGVVADKSIIDEKEFNDKLEEVAKLAISDACTGSNPRQPSVEEMKKLLIAVYYDKDIDF